MIVKSKRLAQLTLQLLCAASFAGLAQAEDFNIPRGDLKAALDSYATQTGTQFIYESAALKGIQTNGVHGNLSADSALSRILTGTGFTMRKDATGAIGITRATQSAIDTPSMVLAQASPAPRVGVETVTVTSSKLGGADVQSIPIAITALSQEQLTATQTAGGPDLVKQVPNLTFTKTNFSGYSIQIRGIGTQAISVTTDPAVAVALNDIPFIRNHFFEQEFYDLSQAEVLRGPQGTLYGRNATAGVVNLVTAKPTDQFEATASADIGNYKNRRFEAMVNLPLVDDRVDLRLAGEWTKRNGYSTNQITGNPIDGRDLWSTRATLGWKPSESVQAYLVWEHFAESDDRLRSGKQLCKTDTTPLTVGSVTVPTITGINAYADRNYIGQGCLPASFYSADAYEVPNGLTLGYYAPLSNKGAPLMAGFVDFDPYASTTQSRDLRVIESTIDPVYRAKNDTLELNVDYNVTPALTVTSQTGYNRDFLWSSEDYNRFNTAPGAFAYTDPSSGTNGGANKLGQIIPDPSGLGICGTNAFDTCNSVAQGGVCNPATDGGGCHPYGIFCDPQLGCTNRLVAEDLDNEQSWQLSQEFRLASHFSGPFNFSVGGNFLHYETEENYYVFVNSLTLAAYSWQQGTSGVNVQTLPWVPGVSDNSNCIESLGNSLPNVPTNVGVGERAICMYIDPNPLTNLDNRGHSYFLSQNPYSLNSYAGFGEAYYNVMPDLKLTGGLRWTDDQKHFTDIPSQLLVHGAGYPIIGVVDQEWKKFTGRFAANWTPKLDFTDQTLVYGSFSRGYKAGGANPPGAALLSFTSGDVTNPIHPLTFEPEFINAYELGTKNTLLDGALTLNGNFFFYDYTGYQISRIVDRTAINDNFDAKIKGAELEAVWEPAPGLRFRFAGGYEHTRINNGQSSIDLMDRTAGNTDWMVMKPFPTQASNCILPVYVVEAIILRNSGSAPDNGGLSGACQNAYSRGLDPAVVGVYGASWDGAADSSHNLVPGQPYYQDTLTAINWGYPIAITGSFPNAGVNLTYPGFDPSTAPNNGEGFAKDLSGHELPNSPPFTVSMSGDYTMPLTPDWATTFHVDYYWQDYSWARVFNDKPYDRLRGYTNVNLALILTSQNGWQVMGYVKNVFDVTDITGAFLNSDDSALTTNVFLTDPRLFGVRVTKNW